MPKAVTDHDIETLTRLNADYIAAVKASDVERFEELLADDFLCSQSDGSLVDRATFLAQSAKPYTMQALDAFDVRVRVLGDVALVHARTAFVFPDGRQGAGRYTDVWARRGDRWLAIAAHVTRCPPVQDDQK